MAFTDFRNLSVLKKAFELLVFVYEITKKYPSEEKFGLISDIRRASGSEIISQAMVSEALSYIDQKEKERLILGYQNVIEELDRLIKTVESR